MSSGYPQHRAAASSVDLDLGLTVGAGVGGWGGARGGDKTALEDADAAVESELVADGAGVREVAGREGGTGFVGDNGAEERAGAGRVGAIDFVMRGGFGLRGLGHGWIYIDFLLTFWGPTFHKDIGGDILGYCCSNSSNKSRK
jgi:hypothetical protein